MEYFDKILPVATAFLTGILIFIGNLIVNHKNYKREIEKDKIDHIKELYHDYVDSINALFRVIDDMIGLLKSIHLEKLTNSLEKKLDQEEEEILGRLDKYWRKIDNVRVKFDFVTVIGIEEDFKVFEDQYKQFELFLDKIEDDNKKVPIGDEEKLFLDQAEKVFDEAIEIIHARLNEFYSTRFLPSEKKLKRLKA